LPIADLSFQRHLKNISGTFSGDGRHSRARCEGRVVYS